MSIIVIKCIFAPCLYPSVLNHLQTVDRNMVDKHKPALTKSIPIGIQLIFTSSLLYFLYSCGNIIVQTWSASDSDESVPNFFYVNYFTSFPASYYSKNLGITFTCIWRYWLRCGKWLCFLNHLYHFLTVHSLLICFMPHSNILFSVSFIILVQFWTVGISLKSEL